MSANNLTVHSPARWQRLKRAAWLGLVLLLAWALFAAGLGLAVHLYGDSERALEEADVLVVLGAGLRRDGSPGPALTRRSTHAAELYRQGLADTIICTGAQPYGAPRTEAEGCRDVLMRQGVPEDAILLEMRSRSTEENAIYAAELMTEPGWQRVIVVSDSYHVFRARWIFTARGLEVQTSAVPASSVPGRTYMYSLVREVAALHWFALKELLGLPVTYIAGL